MIKNKESAEPMIIQLLPEFSFDYNHLKDLLSRIYSPAVINLCAVINLSISNKIVASFSRVKYVDIAPKAGLSAERRGDDIPLFEMAKARRRSLLGDFKRTFLEYVPIWH